MIIIAQRLKDIRAEHRLTQKDFGKILGVSQDTVSLWEKNRSSPSLEYVVIIAKRFDVSSDYLLGLSEY